LSDKVDQLILIYSTYLAVYIVEKSTYYIQQNKRKMGCRFAASVLIDCVHKWDPVPFTVY